MLILYGVSLMSKKLVHTEVKSKTLSLNATCHQEQKKAPESTYERQEAVQALFDYLNRPASKKAQERALSALTVLSKYMDSPVFPDTLKLSYRVKDLVRDVAFSAKDEITQGVALDILRMA